MNIHRRSKAAYLFSEMGGIDDFLLQEAMYYRPARKRPSPIWVAAACLCLCVCLAFGGVAISKLVSPPRAPQSPSEAEQPSNAEQPITSLDGILLNARDQARQTVTDPNSIDLYAAPVLVWQETGDDVLYISRPLSEREVTRLRTGMGVGKDIEASPVRPSCRVWLVLGNGTVETPYLRSSAGNIGIDLFDYDAEIVPDQSVVSALSEILNG